MIRLLRYKLARAVFRLGFFIDGAAFPKPGRIRVEPSMWVPRVPTVNTVRTTR